jgi:RNA polymerase sigma-70 factor (ECF subfamily)
MPATLDVLFREYRGPLFRYLSRAVGQPDAARDLTQDVFLRAARATVPAAAEGELRAWLFQIARNLAIDYHRRQRTTPGGASHVPESARVASQDVVVAVNQALAALADIDRDVFLMHEVAGLQYTEIARACGLTEDAVRSRIHRTRLQLRGQLAGPIAARRMAMSGGRFRDPEGE